MIDLTQINEIHIEPTSLCNAECPQCTRNINGESLNPNITLGSLDLIFFQKIFNQNNVKNIKKIFFCGNVGDPCATPDLLKILRYLKNLKNDIILGINTNGSLKTTEWFQELGEIFSGLYDYVVFSIDGLSDTNHIYRRNTNWTKIMENAGAYISTGAYAHWDMLVFDHNKHQLETAQKTAKEMGFTWFRSKLTDRWDSYQINNVLQPAEKPLIVDYNNIEKINCEKDRDRSVFIDYTGKVWPCCHMASAYLSHIGKNKHSDIKEFNNEELMQQYSIRLEKNPFYVCKRSCGENTGKRSQWKQEIQLK
jgi:MoaA/NifB/PqqE/SkfB family radical SAM enzyme